MPIFWPRQCRESFEFHSYHTMNSWWITKGLLTGYHFSILIFGGFKVDFLVFQGWFLVFQKLIFWVSRLIFFLVFEVVLFSSLINFWFSRLNHWWTTYLRLCNVTDQGGSKMQCGQCIEYECWNFMELRQNKSWRRYSIILFVSGIVDQLRNIILIMSGG